MNIQKVNEGDLIVQLRRLSQTQSKVLNRIFGILNSQSIVSGGPGTSVLMGNRDKMKIHFPESGLELEKLYKISTSSDNRVSPIAEFRYRGYDTRAIGNRKKIPIFSGESQIYIQEISIRTLGIMPKTRTKVGEILQKRKVTKGGELGIQK